MILILVSTAHGYLKTMRIFPLSKNDGGKMPEWKCGKCGYQLTKDTPPDKCPSCNENCEFLDVTCYTPDCQMEGMDHRIKPKS